MLAANIVLEIFFFHFTACHGKLHLLIKDNDSMKIHHMVVNS